MATIVNASHDAIWSWNTAGLITSWNAEAERLFGYSASEMISQSLLKIVPEDRLQRSKDAIVKLLRGEFYGQYETVRLRKDGIRLDVELTVSPIRDSAGNIVGVATVCRDITQRKEVEARLRLAIEAAQLGIWDWNLLTGEMVYSARAKEIYGFAPDAPLTFDQVRGATHPEDLVMTSNLSRRARDPAIREKAPCEFQDHPARRLAAMGPGAWRSRVCSSQRQGTGDSLRRNHSGHHGVFYSCEYLRYA